MAYSDFMDVLGRLHKLTPAQRRAVAEVLAEPEATIAETSQPIAKPKRKGRQPYTASDRNVFKKHAQKWDNYDEGVRNHIIGSLAASVEGSRSRKAIQRQIDYYRNGK